MSILDFNFKRKALSFMCSILMAVAVFGSFTCSVHAEESNPESLALMEISRPKDVETDFNVEERGMFLRVLEGAGEESHTYKIKIPERSYIIINESHKWKYGTWGSTINLYSNASLTSKVDAPPFSQNITGENSRITYWYVEAGTYYLAADNADSRGGVWEQLTLYGYVLPVSKVVSLNENKVNCATDLVKANVKVNGEAVSTMLMADESNARDIHNTSSVWNKSKNAKVTANVDNQYSVLDNGKYALRVEFKSDEWKKYAFDINFTVSGLKPHAHSLITTPATTMADGSSYSKCSVCGIVENQKTICRISKAALAKTSYTYTGKSIKPAVTVKDANGSTISSANYTVSYKNNKYPGKASVTITFKGNYSGTVTETFTIKPKATKISKATGAKRSIKLKWSRQKGDGYEVQYSTSRSFARKKTVTKSASTTSKSLKKLKAGKKYYVRVRVYKKVDGKKIYSAWSNVKTATTK